MILKAKWILPITSPEIEDGGIRICKNIIMDIGHYKDLKKKYPFDKIIDLKNSIILPGFINAHSHIAYTALKGALDNFNFWEWLKVLNFLKYEILSKEDLWLSSYLGCLIAIKNGITTLADTCDSIIPFQTAKNLGLPIIFYYEIFGWNEQEADESIKKAARIIKKYSTSYNSLQKIALSPHSIYTVGPLLFKKLNKFMENQKIPLCIHLAESKEEAQLVIKKKGKLYNSMVRRERILSGNFRSFLSYLEQFDFLKHKPLIIHGVYLNKEDIYLLKKYELGIIHCPSSNLKFGHGIAPVYLFKKNNIKWGLGTDSLASNNRMDMIQEIRLALFLQRAVQKNMKNFSEEELLKIAIIGNAELLNIDKEVGSIEIGKRADLIAIKLDKINNHPYYNLYSAIVNTCSSNDVIFTMINGKIKYHQDKFYTITLPENFYKKVDKLKKKIIGYSLTSIPI